MDKYDTELNGRKIDRKAQQINKFVAKGNVEGGNKLEVKEVEGNLDEFIKKAMIEMSNQAQNYIDFPEEGLLIGDSFTQIIPYNVNIPSIGSMGMKMEMTYTLKEIKNDDVGVFSIVAKIDMNKEKVGILMLSEGSGEMLFNRSINQFSHLDWDLDMDMKIDMDQGNIFNKSKVRTITTMKKTK